MNQSIIEKLEGINFIEDIKKKLNIKTSTAIKYMHLLRKEGFVNTEYGKNRKRIYRIVKLRKPLVGNDGFYHIINKYSPMKIAARQDYRIIGRKSSIEESIVKAIETKNVKVILASLALFNHVKNWSLLSKWAKQYNAGRKVGALYELTKRFMKVRRMDKRTLNSLLNSKNKSGYIVDNFKSKDFKDLEKKWKIFLPFNKIDLREYKQWQ